MKAPIFPAKKLAEIIVEETKSKFQLLVRTDDEMREMQIDHIYKIERLETYEDIDNWLRQYRKISLDEWVKSL